MNKIAIIILVMYISFSFLTYGIMLGDMQKKAYFKYISNKYCQSDENISLLMSLIQPFGLFFALWTTDFAENGLLFKCLSDEYYSQKWENVTYRKGGGNLTFQIYDFNW